MRLNEVHPWGHNLTEYRSIFNLDDEDLHKSIISFADGTSSANSELTNMGHKIISVDPVYQFTRNDLDYRLNEVISRAKMYQQELPSHEKQNAAAIADSRAAATRTFLADFELGKKEQRYIAGSFPGPFPFSDNSFELGLCAHFLLLYDNYGLAFHIKAITEMLRICDEIRIYPLVNLTGNKPAILEDLINNFSSCYTVKTQEVDYGFQGIGTELLRISK
ncbi:hypothetical protein [Sphingobacterium sp. FBM7-1]|uniref:hypothetical protein n=1 Tax=Sphingobacterium sp. FBM7-1 TaxID=2886688 RepID=UPI001D1116C9|nr:hypothetical protein [Sphingobacterium sp. FBM7-1]MCC2599915.1 hypothetical protein [Sphingobacterium sp. FBM7-1]